MYLNARRLVQVYWRGEKRGLDGNGKTRKTVKLASQVTTVGNGFVGMNCRHSSLKTTDGRSFVANEHRKAIREAHLTD